MSQRRFIYGGMMILLLSGLAACALQAKAPDTIAAPESDASAEASARRCETVHRLPSMGSLFEIQIAHKCKAPPRSELILEVQNRLDEMESQMSLYQSASAISQLNKKGFLKPAPDHLRRVLARSLDVSRKTNGLFDATVKNLNAFGYQSVWIQGSDVVFQKPHMQITLDGIAKGYAVDEISMLLTERGYREHLLNFSGNMRRQGFRADKKAWQIHIWNPLTQKTLSQRDLVTADAIASSGEEHQKGHIIDPIQRKPAVLKWAQMTVMGPSAEICDALSTTFILMSRAEIQRQLEREFKGYSAVGILRDGRVQHLSN